MLLSAWEQMLLVGYAWQQMLSRPSTKHYLKSRAARQKSSSQLSVNALHRRQRHRLLLLRQQQQIVRCLSRRLLQRKPTRRLHLSPIVLQRRKPRQRRMLPGLRRKLHRQLLPVLRPQWSLPRRQMISGLKRTLRWPERVLRLRQRLKH